MNKYIGTEIIEAERLSRGDYNTYRGWEVPANENPGDDGFRVVRNLGKNPDDVKWLPVAMFNSVYRLMSKGMSFGDAIVALEAGHKVARKGWNGKNMWVVLMPPLSLPPLRSQRLGPKVNERTAKHIGEDTAMHCQPYFVMWTAQGLWQPGWLASQADMLAKDWLIVDQK